MDENKNKQECLFFFEDEQLKEAEVHNKKAAVRFFDCNNDSCKIQEKCQSDENVEYQERSVSKKQGKKKNAIHFFDEAVIQQHKSNDNLKNKGSMLNNQIEITKSENVPDKSVDMDSKYRKNVQVQVLELIIYLDREGREDYEKSKLKVRVAVFAKETTLYDEFEIALSRLDSIIQIIRKRIPSAVVNTKDSDFVDDIREQTINLPKKFVCWEAGWNNDDGHKKYCFRERTLCQRKNEIKLGLGIKGNLQKSIIAMIAWNALNLYKDIGTVYVMILFSLLGVLFRLFSDAGYPVRFLLFIHGKTGSYKTAIAKVLYMQLLEENDRNKPRRLDQDTLTSLERGLVKKGIDTVTLFDDFRPPQTERQKSTMLDSLEGIIRMVGDGSSKSRSNSSLEDIRGEGVKGAVVVTGEMKGNGHSSNLRCLKLLIEKEKVNLDILTWLQKNPTYYNSFIWEFTRYVEYNWDIILSQISSSYQSYRMLCSNDLDEPRLIDSESTLMIAADIFENFCADILLFNNEQKEWIKKAKTEMHKIFIMNQQDCLVEDPVELFMSSLDYLVSNKIIVLAPDRNNVHHKENIDGFYEKNYIFFKPENLYSKVCKYLSLIGKNLNMSYDSLYKLLAQEKIIQLAKNGGTNTTIYFRRSLDQEGRIKLIKMQKSKLLRYNSGGKCEDEQ